MTIKKGKVVKMSYLLKNGSGEELDRSDSGEPLVYLHGVGQIVPGLERQLEGLQVGDKRQKLEVLPQDGYGEIRPDLVLSVNRAQFPGEAKIEPGMQFWAQSQDGHKHPFTVTAINGDKVEIDGNHPLAGETLYFDVAIEEVRDATAEEMEHGHAHGPDGHHHH